MEAVLLFIFFAGGFQWQVCCSSSGELEEPTALTPQRKARGLEEPFERLLNLNLAASVPVVNESKEPICPNQACVAVKGI